MGSYWRKRVGSIRSFVGNSMGGLKGGANLASWTVAFTLAYFLWIKPDRDLKKQQEARIALATSSDLSGQLEKRKAISSSEGNDSLYGEVGKMDNQKD